MKTIFRRIRRDERGVTAVEYGIIAGVIGAVLILVLGGFSDRLEGVFGALNDQMEESEDRISGQGQSESE